MGKKAVSLTLTTDNLTWLKGRSVAAGESMSELIDQIVSAARRCRADRSHAVGRGHHRYRLR